MRGITTSMYLPTNYKNILYVFKPHFSCYFLDGLTEINPRRKRLHVHIIRKIEMCEKETEHDGLLFFSIPLQ